MRRRLALGIALVAAAALALALRAPLGELVWGPGAGVAQRGLAGGTAGTNPPVVHPVRVILLDGLPRADVPRMPRLAALCAGGTELVVDVGFPTKSLPVQRTLWSGLTSQQRGDRGDNLEQVPPPSSVPLLVPGSIAVAEAWTVIARSAGFPTVLPPPEADRVEPVADPAQVAAWRGGGFAAAAIDVARGPAPLAMIHVLAIDEAAHRDGRDSRAYGRALAEVDALVAQVVAAAPAAQWLVLSDHGHAARGFGRAGARGHGDAEAAVRRVLACWTPSLAGVGRGEVHAVDVARWIADAAHAPRSPHAAGRTLTTAAAHPDPDATLPRPGPLPWALAGLVLAVASAAAAWRARPRWAALAPVVTLVLVGVFHGLPTLSTPARPALCVVAGALPVLGLFALPAGRRRLPLASPVVLGAAVVACALLAGVPGALLGGPPARIPWWSALLAASAQAFAGACLGLGIGLAVDGIRANFHRDG